MLVGLCEAIDARPYMKGHGSRVSALAEAIALYERFGFEREGYRRAHYRRRNDYVDAILMAYRVG